MVVDDCVIPLELGVLICDGKKSITDQISRAALKKLGVERWKSGVARAVRMLQDALWPTDTVLGGGNAKLLLPPPQGCRCRGNEHAFLGAVRLWGGTAMVADPRETSWHIRRLVLKDMLR